MRTYYFTTSTNILNVYLCVYVQIIILMLYYIILMYKIPHLLILRSGRKLLFLSERLYSGEKNIHSCIVSVWSNCHVLLCLFSQDTADSLQLSSSPEGKK